jgi:pectin methylesterase-like acyl-CoA thioesterase
MHILRCGKISTREDFMKTKKGMVLFLSVVLAFGLLCTSVYAGPTYKWNIPDNVRIVQKDNVDDVRIFATIQAAADSITDSSVDTPYIIKVMPGIYNENVVLPSYTTLKGSGRENTILRCSASGWGIQTTDGTPSVEDIAVEGVPGTCHSGVANLVALRNCRVTIVISSGGIAVGSVDLMENCEISIEGTQGQTWGVHATYQTVTIRNSTIWTSNDAIASVAVSTGNADVTITDSTLEADGPSSIGVYHSYHGAVSIRDSVIRGNISVQRDDPGEEMSLEQSKVDGIMNIPAQLSTRIINCYDGNFNPIPNQ